MSTQIQLAETKPTYQEVEQALINILKAGVLCGKPRDSKFIQSYKKWILSIRQAEEPDVNILENAKRLFPTKDKYQQVMYDYKSWYEKEPKILNAVMELYKLYYKLVKDSFITETEAEEIVDDILNL